MIRTGSTSLFGDLDVEVTPDAPIGAMTWYGIGGRADLLVRPRTVESIQTLIRRQGKELEGYRDSDVFKQAAARVPAKRSLLVVSDPRASSGSFFWAGLKDSAPEDIKGLIPEPEFFARFLGVSVFSVSTEEQGLLLNWFYGVKRPSEDE